MLNVSKWQETAVAHQTAVFENRWPISAVVKNTKMETIHWVKRSFDE